jgi:serine protease AprX
MKAMIINGARRPDRRDFDRKNNVEQVTMDHLVPGNVVISVVAHSIAVAPQSYALVARVS